MKYLEIYLFVFLIGILSGCEEKREFAKANAIPEKEVQEKVAVAKAPDLSKKVEEKAVVWYSPFVLDLSSKKMAFKTVSFKDVTSGQRTTDRETTMETLADALGAAIEAESSFEASSLMRYDEEITKPSNHRACGERHLYIDVWEGTGEYGFSMWSGCSADSEFAHSSARLPQTDDPIARVTPLVSKIREKLVDAHSTKCFLKTC